MLAIGTKAQVVNPDSSLFGEVGTIVKWVEGPTPDSDGFVISFSDGQQFCMARKELSARIVLNNNPPKHLIGGQRGKNESPRLALLNKLKEEESDLD